MKVTCKEHTVVTFGEMVIGGKFKALNSVHMKIDSCKAVCLRNGCILSYELTQRVELVNGSFLGSEVLIKFGNLDVGDCFFRVDDSHKRYIKSIHVGNVYAVCLTEVVNYQQMNPEEMVLRYPEEFREEA